MIVYADTSALLAVLDRDDVNHAEAKAIWSELLGNGATLYCSNYVVAECCALIQRRLGEPALRVFLTDIVPMLSIHWIEQRIHQSAVEALLHSKKKGPSLVDRTSFAVMRFLGIERAFAFDEDFQREGFESITTD